MLEDFRLKVFVAVAREKSFTKAASQLKVTQPAVSQNISELEKQFGQKLFERLRGVVLLTPAGELLLDRAKEILSKYDDLAQVFSVFPDTVVRVAASDEVFSYLTEVLLSRFLLVHPEVIFEQAFIDDLADLKVSLSPSEKNRGMLALSYHPSEMFASTRLYKVLSDII